MERRTFLRGLVALLPVSRFWKPKAIEWQGNITGYYPLGLEELVRTAPPYVRFLGISTSTHTFWRNQVNPDAGVIREQ